MRHAPPADLHIVESLGGDAGGVGAVAQRGQAEAAELVAERLDVLLVVQLLTRLELVRRDV